ncbi:MAG: acetate--CoA ligase [Bacteriovoracaceae bacterium]|nr:acetate--CoA ligase [Bacteriovoracaceae bacterium]
MNRTYEPKKAPSAQKNYLKTYEHSLKHNHDFWMETSKRLDWIKAPTKSLEGNYEQVNFKWFDDGVLNVSINCIDRHLPTKKNEVALIWAKDELGEYERITYQQLSENVGRCANMLKSLGVKKGDRVCLYLPMIPELVYSMLACARIGAVHSIVFAGFSAESLRGRIEDAKCNIVITANEGKRGGKLIPLKQITDDAIAGFDFVKNVIVVHRTDAKVNYQKKDVKYEELVVKQSAECKPESMKAEDPLFILYTSGSTGKPKGLLHTSAGYLLYASYTHELVFNYKPGQIYFCAADIGWVTGHSYIVYGPLSNAATSVIFESTPLYPAADRYWKIIDDLKVQIFYTAPTALRTLAAQGDEWLNTSKRSSLEVLGSVGEPINPEIWEWYYHKVGHEKCSLVDTWWQTETGGILISPIPGVTKMKPGSATLPLFGVEPIIVQAENGKIQTEIEAQGALCLKRSWPGQARTIYGDHERFIQTYFSQYKGFYFTGDGCNRDADGFYWITGRIDDVLNCSGHRLGTAEIEGAIVENKNVAEAAVVGYSHDIKGTGIYAYVVLQKGVKASDDIIKEIKASVQKGIGKFASPDIVHVTTGLPKTRSGKVMRRILRKIACSEFTGLGDISTLSEPNVVELLIEERKKIK